MEKIRLGRTGLQVSRSGFGALPIQRISRSEAIRILRAAFDGGIDFFDTARGYFDSESKMGKALEPVRDRLIIATKSPAADGGQLILDLHESMRELRTDYIDVFQFHVAKKCHAPGEPDGLYDAALKAKAEGKIRHIGITAHRLDVALTAAQSGLYDTVQYPMSYLSSESDLALVDVCKANDVGFIAMKALAGGLITDATMAWAFMKERGNILPIWGIQRMEELEEFLALEQSSPSLDDEMRAKMERDRAELSGNFCRGCGYCLPCPADIEITWIARMPQAIRRMDPNFFMTEEWRGKVDKVNDCIHCNACKSRCPYELDTPELLTIAHKDYREFTAEWDRR